MTANDRTAALINLASQRIMIIDGAMGTMIQKLKLTESDFRGDQFKNWSDDVKGNNDLLCLTQPDMIEAIHTDFIEAGADIIETNSFNANSISLADYKMEDYSAEVSKAAAAIARRAADKAGHKGRSVFVAGAVGPTNRTLSISPDVNNPGYRAVNFDQMVACYKIQIKGLMDGGADLILIETIFDTLNAKAALFAAEECFDDAGIRLPLMLSFTVTDMSGRNLSGQNVEAFWYSIRHAKPFSIGLNCAFGAEHLRPHARTLADIADTRLCFYPNAGLPNEMGEYEETPDVTAGHLGDWASEGMVNIVGGCCGTTPEHIRAIAEAVKNYPPRAVENSKNSSPHMTLAGLDHLQIVTRHPSERSNQS